jgi:hypothetical protein
MLDTEDGIGLITRRPACVPWGTVIMDVMMNCLVCEAVNSGS